MSVADVKYYVEFEKQFEALLGNEAGEEIALDVASLINALERHGHDIEGTNHTSDPSHPIVSSRLDMWALRRTPPTGFTPNAENPPVLRIPYVWMQRSDGSEYALVCFIGDKTNAASNWYPGAVRRIENDLLPRWLGRNTGHRARPRRRTS